MSKQWTALAGVMLITVVFSVFWHAILFEEDYLRLGVYTRMNDPIYGFGIAAWLLESVAFTAIFFNTRWQDRGLSGAISYSWLMATFTAASSIFGAAAKINIAHLAHWFLISGVFAFLHFTLLGLLLWSITIDRSSKPASEVLARDQAS